MNTSMRYNLLIILYLQQKKLHIVIGTTSSLYLQQQQNEYQYPVQPVY